MDFLAIESFGSQIRKDTAGTHKEYRGVKEAIHECKGRV
jgi:hypothetical protein